MRRPALILAIAVLSTGCLGSDFANSVEGSWQLTSGTVDGEDIPLVETHPITIDFDGDQVQGTASCNHYGGTFELSGSSVSFDDLAMTEMACFPQETMDAEALYGRALGLVTTVQVDEGLILSGPGVELDFTSLSPVPEAELTNTVWVLHGLIHGDTVSSTSGDRATLEFFTDGSMIGDTGCRLLTGHYVVQGAEVLLTDLTAEGDCDPELADQDSQVVSVLGDGFRAEIDGKRLTIRSVGGDGLAYVADG
jgi:heat shock protein HslJ